MMQTLDGILASCIPKNESARRRRPSVLSISSSRSKVNSMLSPIKETFDDFVQTVTEIPAVIEEGFDHFCHGMVDIPSSIEETFEEVLQCVNELFSKEERGTLPYVKLSLHDFRESAFKERRALVVKSELGLETLMGCNPRIGTQHSATPSDFSFPSAESQLEGSEVETVLLPRVESEMYLMEMTSPGLQTPVASPRMSMIFPDSPIEVNRELSNTSSETLAIETEFLGVVKREEERSLILESSDTSLREVKVESEDEEGIPRYWVSELEQGIHNSPSEIAPGILAV